MKTRIATCVISKCKHLKSLFFLSQPLDLNKKHNLKPHSNVSNSGIAGVSSRLPSQEYDTAESASVGRPRGGRVSELFPSPNTSSPLISSRGGPDLGSLSGHW